MSAEDIDFNDVVERVKEDIITVFLALQKQNFILSNSLMNLVESWPQEPQAMFGILI